METLAVAQQKGGVGKTTTVVNLADAAVSEGFRVLVIDLDPQGNATTTLCPTPPAVDALSVADVLAGDASLEETVIAGDWTSDSGGALAVIPAIAATLHPVTKHLESQEDSGHALHALRHAIGALDDTYDLVLIDCPPALGMLTLNALVAANGVLVVSEPSLYSLDGLADIRETIDTVRTHHAAALELRGVLLNKWRGETRTGRRWRLEFEQLMGPDLLDPPIPLRVAIADAAETGQRLSQSADTRELAYRYVRHLRSITRR